VKHTAADCLVGELSEPPLGEVEPRARGEAGDRRYRIRVDGSLGLKEESISVQSYGDYFDDTAATPSGSSATSTGDLAIHGRVGCFSRGISNSVS
jgi:hypothetical protein